MDRTDIRSLRSGFLAHASRHPDDVALQVGSTTMSYGELDGVARRWAAAMLRETGRQRLDRVGIFAYRSVTAYAGVLAALCTGATYVPLNPTFPVARTASMLRRARLDAVIVDTTAAPQLRDALGDESSEILLVLPDADSPLPEVTRRTLVRSDLAGGEVLSELPPVVPEDLAYLLFTSGTTGEPKGVGVSHGNVRHFLEVMGRRYALTRDDRLSQTFDQTFDLSVFDMFMAWDAGARLCVPSRIDMLAPATFVAKHGLTLWFSVPSVPALMRKKNLLRPGSMPSLRWSLFCGEPLPAASADAWQEAAPNSIVENLFGPTELTIACTVRRWERGTSRDGLVHDFVPIGRPLEGLGALLVDEALAPVAEGEPGELLVSGPQTVPGYWQDPERTAERFVELSISPFETRRFYRTGDRVVRLASGDYAYLGRTDHQIKVLGFRVELGDIEAVLANGNGVVQAAAVGWPVEDGHATGVVGFVVGPSADVEALRVAAQQKLPAYMVPSDIVKLDEFPLNVNGKIDRAALTARLRERGTAREPA